MTELKIIDNFLDVNVFSSIQTMFYRTDFEWFWSEYKVKSSQEKENVLDNYQFTHLFYDDHQRLSKWNINPIIDKLNLYAIVRIKANLNPRTQTIVKYGFHCDWDFDCKTAIYYINSNDGYTEFSDGRIIESVENRMVIFNSNLEHRGTSCTNEKRRIVLNLNYF